MDSVENARKCARNALALLKRAAGARDLGERRALIGAIDDMENAIQHARTRLTRVEAELTARGIIAAAADKEQS